MVTAVGGCRRIGKGAMRKVLVEERRPPSPQLAAAEVSLVWNNLHSRSSGQETHIIIHSGETGLASNRKEGLGYETKTEIEARRKKREVKKSDSERKIEGGRYTARCFSI